MTNEMKIWRPRWLLAGILLGLVVMAWLGQRAVSSDYHPHFTRFFPEISPEASYYPTVGEMTAIVRARCRPDQVLVIVGGNSVLHGVWQPAEVMWTRKLQERLGERYVVINFALRGATPTDGGAVVAEVLRDEFPRQIYIANEKAATGIFPLGSETYRTVFWQAYFGGQLINDAARNAYVRDTLFYPANWAKAAEISGSALLDRALRFRDYWNRVAFERLNTVPSIYAPAPPGLFAPRKLFTDQERDGSGLTLDERYLPAVRSREMEILRATSGLFYEHKNGGGWQMREAERMRIDAYYRDAFPAALHTRTMLLIGRDSAFFRAQLRPDERTRDEQAIVDSVAMLRGHGYAALDYGEKFTAEDYADRTHLAPAGGEKLADAVAPAVRALADKLGYLR
jgi:hypothetical protein